MLADMSVKPIPEGYTSLTPFLCIDGAAAAIDFYVSVFGAKLVDRMDGPDGTVAHAELDFGNGRLQLGDPHEAYQIAAPDPTGPPPIRSGCTARTPMRSSRGRRRPAPRSANPRRPSSPATVSPRSSTRSATAGR